MYKSILPFGALPVYVAKRVPEPTDHRRGATGLPVPDQLSDTRTMAPAHEGDRSVTGLGEDDVAQRVCGNGGLFPGGN